MTESAEAEPLPWQPLTPGGVAAFARASLRWLLLVQFIFAVLAASTAVWFLRTAWFPTVRQAIAQLPEYGQIRSGKLNWTNASPQLLAEGHFLAFVVDTNHTGAERSPAQIQVEFGRDDIFFRDYYSLAGYRAWPYPREWSVGFNRVEAGPWWGAWQPPIQWLAFGGTLFWCMATWALLATIYFIPAWLGGFFANRNLSLSGSWKLAGAALMPGAVVMITGIVFYGFGVVDLVGFSAITAAHVLVGWVYLILGVRVSPKLLPSGSADKNPFVEKQALKK
jgi:hypothetical protein